jgi:hypothetical protein
MMNRGDQREDIFRDEEDRQEFQAHKPGVGTGRPLKARLLRAIAWGRAVP